MPNPAPAPRKPPARRPLLELTRNGKVIARIRGPVGANDLRLIWGIPVLGGGWWTRNRKPIKKGNKVNS